MADELELDLNEDNQEELTRKDSRIKSLSEKVKLTSEERDALAKAKEEETLARTSAEKERDFFKGFSQVSTKYQGATEYQDKIWEKVKAGYDMEDATVAILNKEGKLQNSPQPEVKQPLAAGGSASTGINDTAEKPLDKMSRQEMKDTLLDLERKGELNFFK